MFINCNWVVTLWQWLFYMYTNMISVQWEPSCSMREERRTDTTEVFFAFRNFANSPKNSSLDPLHALTFLI